MLRRDGVLVVPAGSGAELTVDMYICPDQDVHVSERRRPHWTIATARQNLPKVVGLAAREPQDIYRRNELVARVVSVDSTAAAHSAPPSAAELIARIQRVCAEQDYDLPIAPRVERPNPLVEALARRPSKRKRRVGTKKKR